MIDLANFFSPAPLFTITSVIFAGFTGFIAGYLLRAAVIAKHKKRILVLEDEMLSNHSRILALEKQLKDMREERTKGGEDRGDSSMGKLKAL